MDQVKPYVIGVDLGGTNTVFGVVNARGEVVAENSIKTQQYKTAEQFVEAGVECMKPLLQQVGGTDQIQGMAIEFAPNLPWAHEGIIPLAEMFKDAVGIPAKLTNDANAAAMGEMAYGAARGMKNFIVITLGTGVGSGIVINGQLVYGCDGFAGELGHVIMDRTGKGRPCGCGRLGCLEAYCSATGVARTAREILSSTSRPSLLREKPLDEIESLDVSIAAGKGDEVANEIFQFTGKMLGEACADFAAFSSPEAFIFFGGLCKAGDLIMNPIKEAYDNAVLKIFKGKAKFLVSGLMNANAAVLGASALGWED